MKVNILITVSGLLTPQEYVLCEAYICMLTRSLLLKPRSLTFCSTNLVQFISHLDNINYNPAMGNHTPGAAPVFNQLSSLTFWARNYFFLILAHPVYKMWIIHEPNTLQLWNKLHFEEEKRWVYTMFKIFGSYILNMVYTHRFSMFKIFGSYICWINI